MPPIWSFCAGSAALPFAPMECASQRCASSSSLAENGMTSSFARASLPAFHTRSGVRDHHSARCSNESIDVLRTVRSLSIVVTRNFSSQRS